ncbi:stage II sporulation protein M [Thermosediminibacter litoriperuensis]|uniref:Stage II sporulation protein M n=1 Tax=Thermosediminibacter litoriperuensis TaxID=291989 RepID=A0A5S5ARW0_9FIRM|nr:stage II sporulation protein M [Thermosediminibacter litoriperuensis]TYP54258.1 stage II sporulation protein M [Thermosediminibacter litoriperuensis]
MNYLIIKLADYMKRNLGYYFILSFILVAGVIAGSVSVKLLSDPQKQELLNYIELFFTNVQNVNIDSSTVFYASVLNNLKTALVICLAGLLVISFPVILIVIFFRGYILGFTVGFLVVEFGIKGSIFALLSILPQNIIIIPAIISIGVTGMYFAVTVIKNRRRMHQDGYFSMLLSYMLSNLFFCFFLILAGLIEGYISPLFIKLITSYI